MDKCPVCGGPLVWAEGTSRGWLHTGDCSVPAQGIAVKIQMGAGEVIELGAFAVDDGETPEECLATFLHATSMLMLASLGRSPATHCMEPAMKAARAGN